MLTYIMIAAVIITYLVVTAGLRSMSVQTQVTMSGLSPVTSTQTITGEVQVEANPTPSAGIAGTLTTRGSNTAGTITVASSTGVSTGDKVDLYFATGQCYRATVGTVTSTTIPITAVEGGDNLPAQDAAITVGIPNSATMVLVGDNVKGIIFSTITSSGYFVLRDGSTTHLTAYVTPSTPYVWYLGQTTNPIATDSTTLVFVSTSTTTGAPTDMQATFLVA